MWVPESQLLEWSSIHSIDSCWDAGLESISGNSSLGAEVLWFSMASGLLVVRPHLHPTPNHLSGESGPEVFQLLPGFFLEAVHSIKLRGLAKGRSHSPYENNLTIV